MRDHPECADFDRAVEILFGRGRMRQVNGERGVCVSPRTLTLSPVFSGAFPMSFSVDVSAGEREGCATFKPADYLFRTAPSWKRGARPASAAGKD